MYIYIGIPFWYSTSSAPSAVSLNRFGGPCRQPSVPLLGMLTPHPGPNK